VTILKPLFFFF